ncbi:hypothetical protein, partial [Haloquadratum walsbyi]
MSYTRRGAIALLIGGSVLWASETGAFSSAETTRSATMAAGSDETALLGIQGIDSPGKEPQTITLTNQAQTTVEVTIESRNSRLKFNTSEIRLAPGDTKGVSVSTASTESGDVSDSVEFLAESVEDRTDIQAIRQLTIQSDSPGPDKTQLVFADPNGNNNLRVYDPVTDTIKQPPQSKKAKVIGDTADIVGDSRADIPYITDQGDNPIRVTTVGDTEDKIIPRTNSPKPKVKRQRTRFTVGETASVKDLLPPEEDLSVSGKLILTRGKGNAQKEIVGVDTNGNAQVFPSPKGCSAVMGVADIDNDESDEIIFFGTSQELRYLDQGGSQEKVQTGGVGSNSKQKGIGPPADFDGDGVPSIPFVDGSQNPSLTKVAGTFSDGKKTKALDKSGPARKAGVAPVDIDDDGELELAFFGNDDGNIQYVDDVLGENRIETL